MRTAKCFTCEIQQRQSLLTKYLQFRTSCCYYYYFLSHMGTINFTFFSNLIEEEPLVQLFLKSEKSQWLSLGPTLPRWFAYRYSDSKEPTIFTNQPLLIEPLFPLFKPVDQKFILQSLFCMQPVLSIRQNQDYSGNDYFTRLHKKLMQVLWNQNKGM